MKRLVILASIFMVLTCGHNSWAAMVELLDNQAHSDNYAQVFNYSSGDPFWPSISRKSDTITTPQTNMSVDVSAGRPGTLNPLVECNSFTGMAASSNIGVHIDLYHPFLSFLRVGLMA